MTAPTLRSELYRWHAAALIEVRAGLRLEVPQEPQCGWYQRRLVRGGLYIGVSVTMRQIVDDDGQLTEPERLDAWQLNCWIDPHEIWSYCAGQPITEQEFTYLQKRTAHAQEWDRASPFADPRQPVDWLNCKLPTF